MILSKTIPLAARQAKQENTVTGANLQPAAAIPPSGSMSSCRGIGKQVSITH
jgi:hypothetical protein